MSGPYRQLSLQGLVLNLSGKRSATKLHLWPQGSKVGQLQSTFPEATCILPSLRWVLKEGETWTQLITRLHLSPSRLSKEIRPKKSFEVNCQAMESVNLEDRDHMCHPKVFWIYLVYSRGDWVRMTDWERPKIKADILKDRTLFSLSQGSLFGLDLFVLLSFIHTSLLLSHSFIYSFSLSLIHSLSLICLLSLTL